MTFHEFADRLRLRIRRHDDGEPIIPGKYGHLYEHGNGQRFGLMFIPGRARLWAHARRKLEATDFIIWQDGDEEGSALFNPENQAQVSLTLKIVGVKRKRTAGKPTEAQLRARALFSSQARPGRPQQSVETAIRAGAGVG